MVNNSSAPLRFWGEDPVGNCTQTGFAYPNLQEVNFSIDGGAWIGGSTASSYLSYYIPPPVWTPYPNFATGHYGYVDPCGVFILQLSGLSSGTHSIRVRNRNVVYNNPPSSYPGGIWPIPSVGNSCVGDWTSIRTFVVTY